MTEIQTLDDVLGEGAFQAFCALLADENDQPVIYQGVWEADGERIKWPPAPGRYIALNVEYSDVASVSMINEERVHYMGDGLCLEGDSEALVALVNRFSNTALMEWALDYDVREMRMTLPVEMAAPFLTIGFDELSTNGTFSVISGATVEGCRLFDYTLWSRGGFSDDLKPDWFG
jgi:hypothetical protein